MHKIAISKRRVIISNKSEQQIFQKYKTEIINIAKCLIPEPRVVARAHNGVKLLLRNELRHLVAYSSSVESIITV